MAANTVTFVNKRHGAFFGRSIGRLAVAALMAVLLVGVVSDAGFAKPATTTMGQNEFVRQCRAGGGTTKRLAPRVVQCTTGLGEVVICDFNTSPASCIVPFTPQQGGHTAPVTGGVFEQVHEEPSGPVVRPGHVHAVSGGTLEQVDPAPAPGPAVTTGGTVEVVDAVAVKEPASSPDTEGEAAPATSEPVVVEVVEDKEG